MSDEMILKILIGVIIFSLVVFMYAFYRLRRLKKYKVDKKSFGKDSKFLLKIHNFLLKIPLMKGYLLKFESKLKFIELTDQKTIEKKSNTIDFICPYVYTGAWIIVALFS